MALPAQPLTSHLVPPLLERAPAISRIAAAIQDAERGSGTLIMVEGATGTGRSRLLLEACRIGRAAGMLVVRARKGDGDALRRASRYSPHGQPTLVSVDDVCPRDLDARQWLAWGGEHLGERPAVLVLARRRAANQAPGEHPVTARLHLDPAAVVLRLGALGVESVGRLLEHALGVRPGAGFALACHRATGGNPALLRELGLTLAEQRVKPVDSNAALVDGIAPLAVGRCVLDRAAQVATSAGDLLAAIAVLGGRARLAEAATLAGVPGDAAARVLAALRSLDVLAATDPLRFAQPLLRASILAVLSPSYVQLLHRRTAELLVAADGPLEEIATHLVHAAPVGDRAVVGALRLAAHRAKQVGDYESAATYLRRALEEHVPEFEHDLAGELEAARVIARRRESAHPTRLSDH